MRRVAAVLLLVALVAGFVPAGQQKPGDEPDGAMLVTPGALDLYATGVAGGPFEPELVYTVANAGPTAIEWSVGASQPWVLLSAEGGTLPPREKARVRVSIDAERTKELPIGLHRARVDFVDRTNPKGNTWREVRLAIRGERGLEVGGPEEIALAPDGGTASATIPFENAGREPIRWKAFASAPWLRVSEQEGELAPGARSSVVISADAQNAGRLPAGARRASLCLVNTSDGVGTISRPIELTLPGDASFEVRSEVRSDPPGDPGSAGAASSVRRFEITWTFDRDYEVGHFANGDPWVVGPVLVVDISPPSRVFRGRTRNGSMLNPSPRNGLKQGYDSHTYGRYYDPKHYVPKLNVALGVSGAHPLLLRPGSSLVSSITDLQPRARPQLRAAAVLTVLPEAPPEGSFRPPYAGRDKTVRFRVDQLDTSLLARLEPAGVPPAMAEVAAWFERPWIDHVPGWMGGYTHPTKNLPEYGRELADQVGTAALMLHLDLPEEAKRELLVRFVQVGIDNYGVLRDGGEQNWKSSAGWTSGRKWPILFAGLMLGDSGMSGVGLDPSVEFCEDGQTFYVRETPPGSGVYNDGHGNYGPAFDGVADWGTSHTWKPWFDDSDWFGDPYRLCCTANSWWGELLAAYVMDAKELWNHPALFDYQDRFLRVNTRKGILDWRLAWTAFPLAMWKAYRPRY